MSWQDLVITACQVCFVFALIPTIRSGKKPPLSTAAMNATIMTIMVIPLFSMKLYLSAITLSLTALGWWIISFQVWKKHH
jgi:hypothetical protein